MSARAVTLWFLDTPDAIGALRAGPVNDIPAAQRLASSIYGDSVLVPAVDTNLAAAMEAGDPHVYAADFGGLSVISCSLFTTGRPSTLTRTIASIKQSPAATLLYADPETATGTFARWEDGELKRAFSANPVDIGEDVGLPYPFERPFWAGEHPLRYAPGVAPDPLALPFHPQQLAEQSNREWLGFRFTRPLGEFDLDPADIPVTGFAIRPADYEPTAADEERYREASQEAAAQQAARRQAAAEAHHATPHEGSAAQGSAPDGSAQYGSAQQHPSQQYPADRYPSGQNEPGQDEPGHDESGRYQPGQDEPGQYEPEQYEPGQYPAEQYPAEQYPSEQYSPGQYPSGQQTPGRYPPEQGYPAQHPGGGGHPGEVDPGVNPDVVDTGEIRTDESTRTEQRKRGRLARYFGFGGSDR
ncbi:hypothetical protein GCM10009624_17590 [Gordonia sinesedis]